MPAIILNPPQKRCTSSFTLLPLAGSSYKTATSVVLENYMEVLISLICPAFTLLEGEIDNYQPDNSAPFRGIWTAQENGDVIQRFEAYDAERDTSNVWFEGL